MKVSTSLKAGTSFAVIMALSACGSTSKPSADSMSLEQLQAQSAALEARESALDQREAALSKVSASSQSSSPLSAGAGLLPPNAAPGQCFTRIWNDPVYRSVDEQKLVSEASERIELIPARYENKKQRVLVQEASTKLVAVPATYKTVTERVMVKPARSFVEKVPAVYETVTEQIIDKPAHTTWKKGTGPIQRIDASTGEIMCLVEVPATYKTISKRVLKTPATTRTKEIAAEYSVVTKQVVDTPATTRTIEIPAKYKNVTVTEQVQAASQKRVPIPAKYTKVSRRELVKDGQMEWREILCDTNTTPDRVVKIQKALLSAGYNPGAIDGQIGSSTIKAVNAFQKAKGLPVDSYLNVQTVRALGVSVK